MACEWRAMALPRTYTHHVIPSRQHTSVHILPGAE